MKTGIKELIRKAEAKIETISVAEAMTRSADPDTVMVDLRDIRELAREGKIPGAFHAPRGMLEFWVDPDSPYHNEIFSTGKKFIFYCSRGWRSALATAAVAEMGLSPVCHIDGGFTAWTEAGGQVEELEKTR